jgi:hypothetical protein
MRRAAWLRIARQGLHAAALLVTAWSLIATSEASPGPSVPVRDCYVDAAVPGSVVVTLGAQEAAGFDGGHGLVTPSCYGIDGLGPGSVLVFDVMQDLRPAATDASVCAPFLATDLHGVSGVDLGAQDQSTIDTGASALAGAKGAFVSASNGACYGDWSTFLTPLVVLGPAGTASPLDASARTLTRRIVLAESRGCWDVSTTGGTVYSGGADCFDVFAVASVAEVLKP